MNKEDKKMVSDLVDEMMEVNETNPNVMIYMASLMKNYERLEQENKELKEINKEHQKLNGELMEAIKKLERNK